MLLGSPPGAAGNPIGRLAAISVMVPFAGSIWTIRLAPASATISLPSGASAMPSGHLQVFGDNGFLAVGFHLRDLCRQRLRSDRPRRPVGDRPTGPSRSPITTVRSAAVLAAGADQRFAAELVDESAAVASDRVVRREVVRHLLGLAGLRSISCTVPVNQLDSSTSSRRWRSSDIPASRRRRVRAGSRDLAGRTVNGAVGKDVGDEQMVSLPPSETT